VAMVAASQIAAAANDTKCMILLKDRGQKIQVAFNPRGGENFFNLLFDSRCLNTKLYRIIRPHKGKTNIDCTVIGATVRVLMLVSVSVVDNLLSASKDIWLTKTQACYSRYRT
jgi:hypothetical protein